MGVSEPLTNQTDVGMLYDAMFAASAEELDKIKETGIILGHAGVVQRAYEVMNERSLREAGASEDDILDWYSMQTFKDNDAVKKIAGKYGVHQQEPTQQELEKGLRNAVYTRGISIDDNNTSVGYFYQMLYRDFTHMQVTMVTEEGKKEIPYPDLENKLKLQVNAAILIEKGYTTREQMGDWFREREKRNQ